VLGVLAGTGFGLFFFAVSRTSASSGLWPLAAARVATITLVGLFTLLARRPTAIPVGVAPLILLCGALDMGANVAFLLASRAGMLSIVAAVAGLYPGPTVLLACLLLRERLTAARIAGLALALAGVALISAG
jgi:drug/metabolite transporter (DMT)-like permease